MEALLHPKMLEVALVIGAGLAFCIWQLRDVRKAQEQTRREREAASRAEATAEEHPTDPERR